MGIEEFNNISGQIQLPPEILSNAEVLVTIFQIIGGLIGVYVIFWFINMVINARRVKLLEKILNELQEMNGKKPKKLDKKKK